jgi:hypothetical protein
MRNPIGMAVVVCGLSAACGGTDDGWGPEEQVDSTQSEIIAGTLVSTTEAEREGLANVNDLRNMPNGAGSGVVVNRRYLVTAAHVVGGAAYPSQHEIIMGNQRSRISRIWLDSQADLAVAQLDPPLTVAGNPNFSRPLSPRRVVAGDTILMAGASHNCDPVVSPTRPHRYAFLPAINQSSSYFEVGQTFGSPVDPDCETGNVHICSFGDSGGANLLVVNNLSHLAGITSYAAGSQNGYFARCGSVDVFARSNFVKPLIANKKDIWFAPDWHIPYENNSSVWKTFNPCDNACFDIDYRFEFEQGHDFGHFQEMPANRLTQHTGSGRVIKRVCGNATFAVISDGSVQKRGFYDVKATCR